MASQEMKTSSALNGADHKGNISEEFHSLPKLVVFDLDYTLWPYYVDTHIDLPLQKTSNGTVKDARGKKLKIFPEVLQVLDTLKANNILVAAASRTHAPPEAQEMLEYFNMDKYFDFKEIYPGEKTTHFQRIKKDSNVQYDDMLFFDDEERNIVAVSQLNVVCYLVKDGVNMKTFKEGLALYAGKQEKNDNKSATI